MRGAPLLLGFLLLLPALAGCLGDVRQQRTNLLFFLDVSDEGVPTGSYEEALDDFAALEVIVTHVRLKPNTTAAQPVTLGITRTVDLVGIRDGGEQRLVESKIPYYRYDRVDIGVNVTNALLLNGAPQTVLVPENNLYEVNKPFRTRLAGDVAYTFTLAVMKNTATGDYIIQSVPPESGARRG